MKRCFSSFFQTTTSVSDRQGLLRERNRAYALEQYALSGLNLYGQIAIGLSLYLYSHASTAGYLSLLALLPFCLALVLGSLHICRKRKPGQTPLVSALGKPVAGIVSVALAAVSLLDAQLAAFVLCAVLSDVLPQVSSLWVALAVAVVSALAVGGGDEYGLPRLARLIRWVLLLMIGFCAATAAPYGSPGHLAPWLGQGLPSIAHGAFWMSGCAGSCCLPLLLPQRDSNLQSLCQEARPGIRSMLCCLGLGAATALFSAFLLPFYALSRKETVGWRMMLLSNVSPSLPAWSLLLCAVLFLLLMLQATGVTRAAALISHAAGRRQVSPGLLTLLFLLLVPLAALNTTDAEQLLIALSPWRGAVAIGAVGLGLIGSALGQRRKTD